MWGLRDCEWVDMVSEMGKCLGNRGVGAYGFSMGEKWLMLVEDS